MKLGSYVLSAVSSCSFRSFSMRSGARRRFLPVRPCAALYPQFNRRWCKSADPCFAAFLGGPATKRSTKRFPAWKGSMSLRAPNLETLFAGGSARALGVRHRQRRAECLSVRLAECRLGFSRADVAGRQPAQRYPGDGRRDAARIRHRQRHGHTAGLALWYSSFV
jgi:hypothetical protein